MITRKLYVIFLIFNLLSKFILSQEVKKPLMERTVPIATLYSNFHYLLNGSNLGFDIERAYLGFKTQIDENYSIVMKLDIGSPEDISPTSKIRRYAFFKNAALMFHRGSISIRAGLVDTYQFKVQEKFWSRRYMYRSFQDAYRFTPSADIGVGLQYDHKDWLTADISFMNGEGFTKLQLDNSFKTGIGLTLKPAKSLLFRFYYDFINKDSVLQSTIVSFAGFQTKSFNIGAEFNYRINEKHKEYQDRWGYSIYSLFRFAKKWEVFMRFDYLTSETLSGETQGWNFIFDGSALLGGFQYSPISSLKLALSYRDWVPYPPNLSSSNFLFLNLELKL